MSETAENKTSTPSAQGHETHAVASPEPEHKKANKKSMKMWIGVGVGILVVLLGGLIYMQSAAKPVVKERSVKVGVLNPVSGVWTKVGTSIKQGIEFAYKEHAAEGLTVTFSYKDTGCDGPKAAQAAKELVEEGVIAIIGDLCSGSTLEALPIAAAAKIPVVSATSTNPKLSKASPYFSRTIPSDAFSSEFTADYLYKNNIRNLAIIHSKDAYGEGLDQAVTAAFEKLGGKVVTSQMFVNESTNVTTQISAIKVAKPDALYIVTSSSVTWIAIMQKMKDLGITIPVYSSESLKDLSFFKNANDLGEGMYIIAVGEGTPAYIEKHQGAFGTDPDLYNAQAYDASRAVIEALNTGASAGEELKDAIRNVSFDGASGHIQFNVDGDVAPNFTVYKVVDGKFRSQN